MIKGTDFFGMNKFKNTIFYIAVTGGFTALIFWIVSKGKILESGRNVVSPTSNGDYFKQLILN